MAYLIDEQKMLNDNIFKFENRINSPVSRFLDKSPTFVTYFHLNIGETTLDEGFRDIESIISNRSSLRFQKIDNFPVYGLEQIVLNIQDSEQGLDTEHSGECIILPNTIKPLQNDFFIIKYIKESFIFRVIDVQYDTIRPDNFYKIGYRFEWLDDEKRKQLEKQVEEKYSCILQEIGSENSCIIKEEYLDLIDKINIMYDDMMNTYKTIFYNDRYNCFLGENENGYKLYDPLQTVFINTHKLLNKKADYSTIILTEGFVDTRRKIKYEKSIYRFFEKRELKLLNTFPYHLFPAINKKDSAFSRWNDKSIMVVDVPGINDHSATNYLWTNDIVNIIKLNGPTDSKYVKLMRDFLRKSDLTIYDIPLDLNDELLSLDANDEVFFFTPILLFIIRTIVNDFLREKE